MRGPGAGPLSQDRERKRKEEAETGKSEEEERGVLVAGGWGGLQPGLGRGRGGEIAAWGPVLRGCSLPVVLVLPTWVLGLTFGAGS